MPNTNNAPRGSIRILDQNGQLAVSGVPSANFIAAFFVPERALIPTARGDEKATRAVCHSHEAPD
jgi:hypothetical protein